MDSQCAEVCISTWLTLGTMFLRTPSLFDLVRLSQRENFHEPEEEVKQKHHSPKVMVGRCSSGWSEAPGRPHLSHLLGPLSCSSSSLHPQARHQVLGCGPMDVRSAQKQQLPIGPLGLLLLASHSNGLNIATEYSCKF